MIGYECEGRYFLLFVSVHTMEVSVLDPHELSLYGQKTLFRILCESHTDFEHHDGVQMIIKFQFWGIYENNLGVIL